MAEFPILKTGAVMQYPAQRTLAYSTTVLRFIDGSEQRYRDIGSPERTWAVRLELLDEAETAALAEFLHAQQGELYDFSFTDPWNGNEYLSCRVVGANTVFEYLGEGRGKATLLIRENRT